MPMTTPREDLYGFGAFIALNESIQPVATAHGWNVPRFDDGTIKAIPTIQRNHQTGEEADTSALTTFFAFGGRYYCVYVKRTGDVGFGVSLKPSIKGSEYTDRRTESGASALKVFNHVMWLVLKIAGKYGLVEMRFLEKDAFLGSLYRRMVQNKFFLAKLAANGWRYDGEKNGKYVFKKDTEH